MSENPLSDKDNVQSRRYSGKDCAWMLTPVPPPHPPLALRPGFVHRTGVWTAVRIPAVRAGRRIAEFDGDRNLSRSPGISVGGDGKRRVSLRWRAVHTIRDQEWVTGGLCCRCEGKQRSDAVGPDSRRSGTLDGDWFREGAAGGRSHYSGTESAERRQQ